MLSLQPRATPSAFLRPPRSAPHRPSPHRTSVLTSLWLSVFHLLQHAAQRGTRAALGEGGVIVISHQSGPRAVPAPFPRQDLRALFTPLHSTRE